MSATENWNTLTANWRRLEASSGIHCPECGAITRNVRDDDGDLLAVCTDDDCPRIVVTVLSRPSRREKGAA